MVRVDHSRLQSARDSGRFLVCNSRALRSANRLRISTVGRMPHVGFRIGRTLISNAYLFIAESH